MYQIANLEDIKISQKDYDEYIEEMLKTNGYTKETFEAEKGQSIEEYANENNLFTSCLYKKVMQKVMEYSVAK